MAELKQLYCKSPQEWRKWLARNHARSPGVWLVFYKKGKGKPTMKYDAAVEEALCFGWVDSIIKKLDEEKYARKFTPRKEDSNWSESNKKRVAKLIRDKRMAKAGLVKIEAAKKNGQWDKPDRPPIDFDIPPAFQKALKANPTASRFFEQLAPSYRRQYIAWIAVAKRAETRDRRIKEAVELLAKGEKLGMR